VADDVLQARSIELLDDQGQPSLILSGTDEEGKAGLIVSRVEADAPMVTIGIDQERNAPFLLMATTTDEEGGASAAVFFDDGEVFLTLRNADGSEMTITPGM
jgi:hypothetical protein